MTSLRKLRSTAEFAVTETNRDAATAGLNASAVGVSYKHGNSAASSDVINRMTVGLECTNIVKISKREIVIVIISLILTNAA